MLNIILFLLFFYKMNKGSLIFDVFLCFEESEGGHTITAKKID